MTFLLLVLGHFLSDFWLQSDKIATNKELFKKDSKEDRSFALKSHVFTHMTVTTFILLVYTVFFKVETSGKGLLLKTVLIVMIIIINGILHYFVDSVIRPRLRLNKLRFRRTMPYLIDQVLHVSTIFLLLSLSNIFMSFLSKEFLLFKLSFLNSNPYSRYVALSICLVILTSFTGILIEFIFADLESEHDKESSLNNIRGRKAKNENVDLKKLSNTYDSTVTIEEQYSPGNYETEVNPDKISKRTTAFQVLEYEEINNYGKIIGYFERIIIFIAILSGKIEAITILLGLKTFSRFKQLDSKKFTEKYILGTLISSTVAILMGILYLKLFP